LLVSDSPVLESVKWLTIQVPAVFKITEPTEEEARGGMTEGEKVDLHEDFRKTGAELGGK
jgi:hypothetical protein